MFRAIESPRKPEHLPEFLSREMHRLENEMRDGGHVYPTLANTWANVGGEYAVVAYHRDHHMDVHLQGVVSGGTRATDSYTVVMTLPVRYRPLATQVFACVQGDASPSMVRVDVTSAGVVKAWKWDGTRLSLSGVSYLAEQ